MTFFLEAPIFKSILFRSMGAAFTSFLLCFLLAPLCQRLFLRWMMVHSTEREYAEKIHGFYAHKKDVPTLGGVLILLSITAALGIWGDLRNRWLILGFLALLGLGLVGLADDLSKIRKKNTRGLRFHSKILAQWGLSFLIVYLLYPNFNFDPHVVVPFVSEASISLVWLYVPFAMSVIVGSSNALNITDGLDGLAIGLAFLVAATLAILSYLSGHALIADYLGIPFFLPAGEMTVFCAALMGASLAFLWYNSYPASFFMGDTGSLALGGALGAVAVFIRQELVFVIVSGVLVWEALSVILQVCAFKLTGRRIFRMAPYHHHLQLQGWSESKITIRFWITGCLLALVGLATLKVP